MADTELTLEQEIQAIAEQIDATIDSKAGTVSGMGFSSNDYTNEEKEKLAGIAPAANNYRLPVASKDVLGGVKTTSTLIASQIEPMSFQPTPIIGGVPYYHDTTYTVASKTTAGLMSKEDKEKLDGISKGSNAYTLPEATDSVLGGVKVGDGLKAVGGVLSVPTFNAQTRETGLVPAPRSGLGSAYFLCADGLWQPANFYVLPFATPDSLGGVMIGEGISALDGKISVPTYSGYGPGLVPTNSGDHKILTGAGWAYLDASHLPVIADNALGAVKVSVVQDMGTFPNGYPLEVIGTTTGKLYAKQPTISLAHGALIAGATSGIWGPADGLMPGSAMEKLSHIDEYANNYALPVATSDTLGGVRVASTTTIVPAEGTAPEDYDEGVAAEIARQVEAGELTELTVISQTGKAYAVLKPVVDGMTQGAMSAADKAKLDGIAAGANAYTLPVATDATLGGVKVGGVGGTQETAEGIARAITKGYRSQVFRSAFDDKLYVTFDFWYDGVESTDSLKYALMTQEQAIKLQEIGSITTAEIDEIMAS